jgi:hypothetical protein
MQDVYVWLFLDTLIWLFLAWYFENVISIEVIVNSKRFFQKIMEQENLLGSFFPNLLGGL